MTCILCSGATRVINSRYQKRTNGVWRRRQCTNCDNIYTSIEKIDLYSSWRVRTKDSKLVPFARPTLFTSIYECCKHLPDPAMIAEELTNTILVALTKQNHVIIKRNDIVKAVVSTLNNFDQAAAVQYSAFHKL